MAGLHLEQFRCGDNLAYLLYGKKEAVAIDGVAWEEILGFLDKHGLSLTYVTNTHGHFDHTAGNEPLLRHSRALYLDHNKFPDGGAIAIEGESIRVYRTPGHTADSVCFHAGGVQTIRGELITGNAPLNGGILLTGDTLFNGTVGNCFSGDQRAFFRSIKRLMSLPGDTLIFAGHDYVRDSVAMAEQLEPDNPDIERFRQAYDPGHVYSTLAEELKINPYLRFNAPAIIALLKKHGLPCGATEEERWLSLMSLE
ncbi:MAG: hydroxyacylglutathione hydrolase [Syntrophales bacterium]|jgi:hydroxyacylglutathione hydrolase|nr:hydroxyacylglutathione hydrolase [Syntrophales bacterium]MCK9391921.1 hydroxyacylglutathione hydrolase [Syntrophales bacterium]